MRNTKSAFTLVELIVVITILAILGTIAFISLQGYSAEARNSKRVQDLSSISSALNIQLTNGMNVLSAVADSSNKAALIALGGATGSIQTGKYNAGNIYYTGINMKESEFSDPQGNSYAIGATTLAGGPFQLAASMEDDIKIAKVSGNYNARTNATTTVGTGTTYVTVDLTAIGKFKVGDTTNLWQVTRISSDGTTISTDGATNSTATVIKLMNSESNSLISNKAKTAAVVNDGTILPY